MLVIRTIVELKSILLKEKKGGTVGFVPTMGALHKGHLSLVEQSVNENKVTIASIFVNPTQFNDKSDLEKYPRNLKADCKMLENEGCNLVFAPDVNEMYPEPDNRIFKFGILGSTMEGKHRDGHFNGVGQIVSKLFDAVEPDKAYFGLKDFQQLAIIQKLVSDFDYPIKIVPCEIIREPDGLAMSSRNTLLEKEKREAAPFIYKSLLTAKKMAETNSPESINKWMIAQYESNTDLELEYFEIVDSLSLQQITSINPERPCTACIAVYAGKVRLIDNVQIIS